MGCRCGGCFSAARVLVAETNDLGLFIVYKVLIFIRITSILNGNDSVNKCLKRDDNGRVGRYF
jgi:hypothetical protein